MRHLGLCAASLAVLTSDPVLWNANLIDEVSTASMVEAGAAIGHGDMEPFLFRGPPGAVDDIFAAPRSEPDGA